MFDFRSFFYFLACVAMVVIYYTTDEIDQIEKYEPYPQMARLILERVINWIKQRGRPHG